MRLTRMGVITDLTYPLLLVGTYLFLPFTYLLLSSDIFTVDSTSGTAALTLISLVFFVHIYTFIIGCLVHRTLQRRKEYVRSLKLKVGLLPMYSLGPGNSNYELDKVETESKGIMYGWVDQTSSLRAMPTSESWEKATKTLVFNEEGVEILGIIGKLKAFGCLGQLEAID